MAGSADPAAGRREHLVRGLEDRVIAVALDAPFVEDLLVHAEVEFLSEYGVTRAADIRHGADPGRRRTMVAVAVVAGRCGQVTILRERSVVDALLVIGKLRRRQRR